MEVLILAGPRGCLSGLADKFRQHICSYSSNNLFKEWKTSMKTCGLLWHIYICSIYKMTYHSKADDTWDIYVSRPWASGGWQHCGPPSSDRDPDLDFWRGLQPAPEDAQFARGGYLGSSPSYSWYFWVLGYFWEAALCINWALWVIVIPILRQACLQLAVRKPTLRSCSGPLNTRRSCSATLSHFHFLMSFNCFICM